MNGKQLKETLIPFLEQVPDEAVVTGFHDQFSNIWGQDKNGEFRLSDKSTRKIIIEYITKNEYE